MDCSRRESINQTSRVQNRTNLSILWICLYIKCFSYFSLLHSIPISHGRNSRPSGSFFRCLRNAEGSWNLRYITVHWSVQRSVQRSHRSSDWPPFLPWQSTHLRAHLAGHSWCLSKRLYVIPVGGERKPVIWFFVACHLCLVKMIRKFFVVWFDRSRSARAQKESRQHLRKARERTQTPD